MIMHTIARLARYTLTAGTAAITDLGAFAALHRLSGLVVSSALASWLAAAFVNYTLTSRFVFFQPWRWLALARFLCGALVGLAVNVGITWAGTTWNIGQQAAPGPVQAKALGIATAFLFNFAINAFWVFDRDAA